MLAGLPYIARLNGGMIVDLILQVEAELLDYGRTHIRIPGIVLGSGSGGCGRASYQAISQAQTSFPAMFPVGPVELFVTAGWNCTF